jgi:hypothetical protein
MEDSGMGCTYCHGPVDCRGVEVCAECHKDRGFILGEISQEVLDAHDLAALEYSKEVLSGNEVKMAYWRGELEALNRLRIKLCLTPNVKAI